MASHLASLWKWDFLELINGLFSWWFISCDKSNGQPYFLRCLTLDRVDKYLVNTKI